MVLQPWTVAEFVGPKNQMNQCMRPAIKLLIKAVNAQRSLLISQKIIMSWPCHCSNGIKSLCPAEAMRKASRLPSLSWICRDFTPRCWVTLRLVGHTRVMLRCSFPPESLPVVTPSPSRWWPESLPVVARVPWLLEPHPVSLHTGRLLPASASLCLFFEDTSHIRWGPAQLQSDPS